MNEECPSPGKHPLLRFNWKIVATNDLEKINRWRERNKYLNFAIATGRKSPITEKYLVVVDVDKNQHDIIAKLPRTFSYKTGGGGYHFWYWSKYLLKNSVSLLDKNVDIRGKNGYVVIPPSKHILGNYELISSEVEEIADLPKFIYEHVFSKKLEGKEIVDASKKQKKGETSALINQWTEYSVPYIRQLIAAGNIIPSGVRNVTCFRILASERAKGTLELGALIGVAKELRKVMEQSETFTDEEIDIIARSAMKYPAYNNAHEKVNQCYIRWLEKNGIKVDDNYKMQLSQLDDAFFAKCLTKTDGLKSGAVSLKNISLAREAYFKSNDLTTFSIYKPQLLAKKLEEMGFKRIRTAKGNLWAVSIHV
jgi:hypothetical protein